MDERQSGLHILVVDDDPLVLEITEAWLVEAGYRVTPRAAAVGTAADVVTLRPDIVLLDVLMPGLRGDDLTRLLKRHASTQNVPVILFSGMPGERLRPLIMTTGAIGAIEKTSSQAAFTFAFNCLITKLKPSLRTHESRESMAPAASGTYRVASELGPAAAQRGVTGRKLG